MRAVCDVVYLKLLRASVKALMHDLPVEIQLQSLADGHIQLVDFGLSKIVTYGKRKFRAPTKGVSREDREGYAEG